MKELLTLTVPGIDGGNQRIEAPAVIPTGGLEGDGAGAVAVRNGLSLLIAAIAILSVIFLVWGGIKWITSAGDKAQLDTARKTIIFSLIGLILSFLSFGIIVFIGQQVGIEFFYFQ